jgi:hypothetical protein
MAGERTRLVGREWGDENRETAFPFSSRATLRSTAGRELPVGALVDALLYPPRAGVGLYLRRLVVAFDSVRLEVTDAARSVACSGTFRPSDRPAALKLADADGRPCGVVVLDPDRAAGLALDGPGEYLFDQTATEFSAVCTAPAPDPGVAAFRLPTGQLLTGRVSFVGGPGVRLSAEPTTVAGADGRPAAATAIVVDVVGDPLYRRRLCAGDSPYDAPVFTRVVRVEAPGRTFEVPVGPDGEFTIFAGDGLTARPAMRFRAEGSTVYVETAGEAPQ